MSALIPVFVHGLKYEAADVIGIDLRPVQREPLPTFAPGAHIDLHLAGGLIRSYSLVSPPSCLHQYSICVQVAQKGRGGSRYIYDALKIGSELNISAPRNNFRLDETAHQSVLIAGGIGITPIFSMLDHLRALGRSVEVLYCARSRRAAAFVDRLQDIDAVTLHFDDEARSAFPLEKYLAERSADAHFYCCGPASMLEAFESACMRLGLPNWHIERFSSATPRPAQHRTYEVELRKSGRVLEVRPGHSLLETVLAAGIDCDHACKEGICGACETSVIEGSPEHRDAVLTQAERATNTRMMICVSGSLEPRLVLDL